MCICVFVCLYLCVGKLFLRSSYHYLFKNITHVRSIFNFFSKKLYWQCSETYYCEYQIKKTEVVLSKVREFAFVVGWWWWCCCWWFWPKLYLCICVFVYLCICICIFWCQTPGNIVFEVLKQYPFQKYSTW